MKKTKKFLLCGVAVIALVIVVNFMPKTSQAQLPDGYKSFENCWGSGNSVMSCTNGDATVYGCQPDPGSYCVGKKREEETLPEP